MYRITQNRDVSNQEPNATKKSTANTGQVSTLSYQRIKKNNKPVGRIQLCNCPILLWLAFARHGHPFMLRDAPILSTGKTKKRSWDNGISSKSSFSYKYRYNYCTRMMSTTSRLMMLNCRACTFRGRFINRVIVPSVCIPRRRPHSSSSSSGDENDQGFTATTSSSLSTQKGSGSGGNEWRKLQLEKIENKFSDQEQEDPSLLKIKSDEELQEMWRQMESRVKNRRPRTLREAGGKTGRVNVKKTDEEMWLKEGLYSSCDDDDEDDDDEDDGQRKLKNKK